MDSILEEGADVRECLNVILRNPSTIDQDLSNLAIKLQLIEQDLELNLDYQSYSALTTMQLLKSEIDSIYKQTSELIQEAAIIGSTLNQIITPEIRQLQHDHEELNRVNSEKNHLKEIEHLESKIQKASELMHTNTNESVTLIKSLYNTYKKIENSPQHAHYKERISDVVEAFEQTLTDFCLDAAKSKNIQQLKKLAGSFACIERSDRFKEILSLCRIQSITQSPIPNNLDAFSIIKDTLQSEIVVFKELIEKPEEALREFVTNYLLKVDFSDVFKYINLDNLETFFDQFLSLSKALKSSIGNLQFLELYVGVFNKIVPIEKQLFERLEKTSARPISLESWTKETSTLLAELENSWNRVLRISFGTCGYEWAKMAEEVLSSKISQLGENYSEIFNFSVDLIPDFEKIDFTFKFKWDYANKFVKVYEEIIKTYLQLENISEKCRNSYLQSMTTSYFSPQLETQKELQALIFKSNEKLQKNSLGFISFLREGGVFFVKALEMVEKELEICKNYIEKLLMSAINGKLHEYSALDVWKSEEGLFSEFPSQHIISCGEHILAILQFLSASDDDFYSKAFHILFSSKPPGELPHSKALHFWIVVFFNKFLRIYIANVGRIKELTNKGQKYLLADVDYVFNIAQALGIYKQEELSCGQSLLALRNKLQASKEISS